MPPVRDPGIQAAEVVLPCADLDATLRFFTERLAFRIAAVLPADDPAVVVVEGHGVRLRLERGAAGPPGVVRLLCRDPAALADGASALVAPNGTRIELVAADAPVVVPPLCPSFVLTRPGSASAWRVGRAGMRYRDLIPDRQGGRFIASHIHVPDPGPVPDFVHFHRVAFQMIYCYRGWACVVYEDQGPPFRLEAGDCVLQPPRIRHRVLESGAGLEVIEISSPAEHETLADPDLELPTATWRRDRVFESQRFVRHLASDAAWAPDRRAGFEARDLGIAAATGGRAAAWVSRWREPASPPPARHDAELRFTFVLDGAATLECAGRAPEILAAGDAFVVPAGVTHRLTDAAPGLALLEVALPAAFSTLPDETARVPSPAPDAS
jgi:quercetin dioxygenase-like cupin family protein/catechol 2,3-dioxygenase-like lactoylglutathione lyase family enzyme